MGKTDLDILTHAGFFELMSKLEREWIDLFDRLRETRHADQYDVSYFATKEEAESALISHLSLLREWRNS